MRRVRAEARADSPLFAAVRARDADAVRRALADGANPRLGDGRESALHVAARLGPLAVVEALIAGGALEWQPDAAGRIALDAARRGRSPDRGAIVMLLDRGVDRAMLRFVPRYPRSIRATSPRWSGCSMRSRACCASA